MKSRLNEGVGNTRIKRHNSISIDVRFALQHLSRHEETLERCFEF